jgi:hypothetical protein
MAATVAAAQAPPRCSDQQIEQALRDAIQSLPERMRKMRSGHSDNCHCELLAHMLSMHALALSINLTPTHTDSM